MRPRGQSAAQADAVSRRLELLGAELRAVNEPAADQHTHIRPGGPSDPWLSVLPPVSGPVATGPETTAAREDQPTPRPEPEPEPEPARVMAELPRIPETEPPAVPVPGRHAARRGVGRSPMLDLSALRGRVALTPAHVAVIAVMVAIGLAVTTWWVLRDDPGSPVARGATAQPLTTPLGAGASAASPSVVASESPGSTAKGAVELVVDVTGKVRRPGIVVLAPGSRVVDAVDAAGGAKKGVSLRNLNLAKVLQDGEQILVGVTSPPGTAASAAPDGSGTDAGSPADLININTASATDLEELSGVGPVTAEAIIDWRSGNGGFQSVDQLLEVDGIGEKTLADLSPHVTVG
ncbi:MAG: helix-hairpin-helix domain-containing protein [Nocardioides sp.]|nr:helix-hairpin-helix domain-containing protein [Nocardioides sp.]